MIERWTAVRGHEGEFEVSNLGRIKSLARHVRNGNGQRIVRERIRALGKHPQGYLTIAYKVDSPPLLVHRVVAQHFIPNPCNKEFVNHLDGNKLNNTVENLEWVTREENEKHALETGLKCSAGSRNSMAKLKEEDVRMIRQMKGKGMSLSALSTAFGVHKVTIGRIVNNKIWQTA
jgi:hypothetical protein